MICPSCNSGLDGKEVTMKKSKKLQTGPSEYEQELERDTEEYCFKCDKCKYSENHDISVQF